MEKKDIPVTELVPSFLMHQEDRNHSPKTVRWYGDMLGRFADWLGPGARLQDINADGVRGYARAVRSKDLSKFTAHSYIRTVKTFIRWLEREGCVDDQVSNHVELPKVPKWEDVTIDILSDEEIATLLSLLDPATDVGCRDRAIVCLMLESGLRLGRPHARNHADSTRLAQGGQRRTAFAAIGEMGTSSLLRKGPDVRAALALCAIHPRFYLPVWAATLDRPGAHRAILSSWP